MSFEIKAGDLQPPLRAFLTDENGVAVPNLSMATSIQFRFSPVKGDTPTTVTGTAALDDEPTAAVSYTFSAGETDVVGRYCGEFIVNWPTGPQTFPSEQFIEFDINEHL